MPQLYFDDPTYNIVVFLCLIFIPAIVNKQLNRLYIIASNIKNSLNKNGKECAFVFINRNSLKKVDVFEMQGVSYLENYSHKNRALYLCVNTYNSQDIASMGKVFYLLASDISENKEKYDKLEKTETIISLLYIILGPGFLWFGLLFKLNILVYLGLLFHLLHAIYHLLTYKYIKTRTDIALEFINKLNIKKEEKILIEKIYKRQEKLYLLAFALEGVKLFNFLLPRNMKKIRYNKN